MTILKKTMVHRAPGLCGVWRLGFTFKPALKTHQPPWGILFGGGPKEISKFGVLDFCVLLLGVAPSVGDPRGLVSNMRDRDECVNFL